MIFVTSLTVPANTLQDSPVSISVDVLFGRVTEVEILFPDGCVGLVGVRIRIGDTVIWPTNSGEWIYGNDETVQWIENVDIEEEPVRVTFYAHSEGTTYPHTLFFRVPMLETTKVKEDRETRSLFRKLVELFGS